MPATSFIPTRKETWKHQDIFEQYLLLGPQRTIPQLSALTGINKNQLWRWARDFGWTERCSEQDGKALAIVSAETHKTLQTVIKRRHQEAYKDLGQKAVNFIKSKASFSKSKTAMRDAAVALDIAIKGERDVLGMRDVKMKGAFVKDGLAAMVELVMGS